jgi:hypothetical protein
MVFEYGNDNFTPELLSKTNDAIFRPRGDLIYDLEAQILNA